MKLVAISKDFVIPVLVALIPFVPSIYSRFTDPGLHFVYEVQNERNPVEKWNRQVSKMFKQLENLEKKAISEIPAPLLKKIGEEIYDSLPAMLSGIGFHPMDSSTVNVLNTANQELRNIRVHFTGCVGFDSYETWPDSIGSSTNPSRKGAKTSASVTLRYDKLSPSTERTPSYARIIFFGESTQDCEPKVEAELPDGRIAVGKKAPIREHLNEVDWKRARSDFTKELFFKVFFSAAVLFFFFQIRGIKQREKQNDRVA